MKPYYTLNRDGSVQWIGLPNNGGELGPDLDDIVEELNRLHQELNRLQHERDSALARIQVGVEILQVQ